jgi:hypothetical protein
MLKSRSHRRKTTEYEEATMSEFKQKQQVTSAAEDRKTVKMSYQKPAFRHESVFETSALTCGKVQNTQSGCHANRKNS